MTTTEIILLIADSTNALLTLAAVALVAALARISHLRFILRDTEKSQDAWIDDHDAMQQRAFENERYRGEAMTMRNLMRDGGPEVAD